MVWSSKFITIPVLLALGCPVVLKAELIDRILAVVNREIITLSDLEQEQKFQAADQVNLPILQPPSEGQRQAHFELLQKLIEQSLIRQQIQQFPGIEVSQDEVEKQIASMAKKNGSAESWEQQLRQLELTPQELQEHVKWQLQVMKFFDYRFRQFVVVDQTEIETYYNDKFVPELATKGIEKKPPLAEVEEQIRALLTEEKLNLQIEDWLKSLRESATIEIFD
jgi:peptidyl-prolyl cis-trans isomerase SurA